MTQNDAIIPGLVAKVYPNYFRCNFGFGLNTNCYTFMRGFDDVFMKSLGIAQTLRPEQLGWCNMKTKEEWNKVVCEYFNPKQIPAEKGSTADRLGNNIDTLFFVSQQLHDELGLIWTPPTVDVICFPMIEGALDYHWAIFNGLYWIEQAGQGGPIQIWENLDSLVDDVYKRTDSNGINLYIRDSAFMFQKQRDF